MTDTGLFPGDVVVCSDMGKTAFERGLIGRCLKLRLGMLYMVLDTALEKYNLSQPSVLVRNDEGVEVWALAKRFTKETQ